MHNSRIELDDSANARGRVSKGGESRQGSDQWSAETVCTPSSNTCNTVTLEHSDTVTLVKR